MPFLIFTPRRLRMFAASCIIIGLQILIALTGNYTFFNVLTIVLCVFLFDDQALKKMVGTGSSTAIFRPRRPPSTAPMKPAERIVAGVFAAVIAVLGFTHVLDLLRRRPRRSPHPRTRRHSL